MLASFVSPLRARLHAAPLPESTIVTHYTHVKNRPPRSRTRLRRTIAGALAAVLGALTAVSAALPATAAAGAACNTAEEYCLQITGPSSIPIYDWYGYTVTLQTNATVQTPVTGITLTATLPKGLTLDSVNTESLSPISHVEYDAQTGKATLTVRDLQESLSSFGFSVLQTDNTVKDPSSVYTVSIDGSASAAGIPLSRPISIDTKVTGDLDYLPLQTYTAVPGSGNRELTYAYNVMTKDQKEGEHFTSWSQTLVDTIPAGAVITGSSTGFGKWTFETTPSGDTKATWQRAGAYGPASTSLDSSGGRIWLTVEYPQTDFPDGSRPPASDVRLTVTDKSGVSYGPTSTFVQGPEISSDESKRLYLVKEADADHNDRSVAYHSGWLSSYRVQGSYFNSIDVESLDSLVVEDSSTYSAANAEFFDHADIRRLSISFNSKMQSLDLPYTLEYTTSGSPEWKTYDTAGASTESNLRLTVQTIGSAGIDTTPQPTLELPEGEWLTGWRVSVAASYSQKVVSGAAIIVQPSYVASVPSLSGTGTSGEVSIVHGAEARGTLTHGDALVHADTTETVLRNQVPIITTLSGPSTINVGQKVDFVANISNLDSAGIAYTDSVMKIVLPVGVSYDAAKGVSAVRSNVAVSEVAVPTVGDGLTVSTEFLTVGDDIHEVVVLRFDELESIRTSGSAWHGDVTAGFTYRIPTQVLAQAFRPAMANVTVSSWAYTEDADYDSVPMGFHPSFFSGDTYDFQPELNSISRAVQQPAVTTAGALLVGKQVKAADAESWSTSTTVPTPGGVDWQVYVMNALPNTIDDVVVYDRMPHTGDARSSGFDVTLDGPVTGVPAGATVEYSKDATDADSGTWTDDPMGATAFKVTIPSIASGASVTLEAPTTIPSGVAFGLAATNFVQATGDYLGEKRAATSNDARVLSSGTPALSVVKKTNGAVYNEAPGAVVETGSTVDWTYTVTNRGDTPLDDIILEDAFTDGEGATGVMTPESVTTGPLMPGESRTYKASAKAVEGQYHNIVTASASAVDKNGAALPAQPEAVTDESWYLAGVTGLSVAKTTNGETVDAAPGPLVEKGAPVAWNFTVTNTGTLTLRDVHVVDTDRDGHVVLDEVIPSLAAGESVGLSADGTAIAGQYRNDVRVSAANPTGGAKVEAEASSWYFGAAPSVAVTKQASAKADGEWGDSTTVTRGESTYWKIVVTNDGNVPLDDVVIDDPALQVSTPVGPLEPGASHEAILTQEVTTESYDNVVDVHGVGPLGTEVSSTAQAHVDAVAPPTPQQPEPEEEPEAQPEEKPRPEDGTGDSGAEVEPESSKTAEADAAQTSRPALVGDGTSLTKLAQTGGTVVGIQAAIGLVLAGVVLMALRRRSRTE